MNVESFGQRRSDTAQTGEWWRARAACRGPQAVAFFPPPQFERKVERLARENRAKEICGQCDVRVHCLGYAVEIREAHGIWGGLNESERRLLWDEGTGASLAAG